MIELQNVTVVYPGDRMALSNVSLRVEKGEFVFLVGPTGSGKSTLLKLLYREESPTVGSISVAGKSLNHMRSRDVPYLRRKMGIVFQTGMADIILDADCEMVLVRTRREVVVNGFDHRRSKFL